jgi:hypothetical protein
MLEGRIDDAPVVAFVVDGSPVSRSDIVAFGEGLFRGERFPIRAALPE